MNSRSRRLAEFLTFLVCFLGSGSVRWKFVHGLFENAIYGGRVDNTFDAKVLQSYLLQYFEQAVFPGQVRWLPQNIFLEIKLVSRYCCALQSLRGQNGRLIAGFRKVPPWRIIRERLPLFVAQCMWIQWITRKASELYGYVVGERQNQILLQSWRLNPSGKEGKM